MENKIKVKNMVSALAKFSTLTSREQKMRACGFLEACLLQYGKLEWGQSFDYQEVVKEYRTIFRGVRKYKTQEGYFEHIIRLTKELIHELDV
jgi:hypothetical protein